MFRAEDLLSGMFAIIWLECYYPTYQRCAQVHGQDGLQVEPNEIEISDLFKNFWKHNK